MKKLLTLLAVITASLAGFAWAQDTILDNYVAVADALAQDDLSGAKTAAVTLADSAKGTPLAEPAAALAKSDSLASAREQFKAASAEAIKLSAGKEGYYTFTCPMAKAEWLQKSKDVRNPYMGKAMQECGSLKDQPAMSMMPMGGCCG